MENQALLPTVQRSIYPVPPAPAPQCLQFYSQCAMQGKMTSICTNTANLGLAPIAGHSIGQIFPSVLFFSSPVCNSGWSTQTDNYGCYASNDGNINTAGVIVNIPTPPKGCIWVYNEGCLSGQYLEICTNNPNLAANGFGNAIGSIASGPGVKSYTVYMKANYSGAYASIGGTQYGMPSWGYKTINSIKITLA